MSVSIDLAEHNRPAPEKAPERQSLLGLSRESLAERLRGIGVPEKQLRMRAGQLWHWLYVRGVDDFSAMANISKDLRTALADNFEIARPEIVEEQISVDGTRKWLFRFPARGAGRPVEIETVYIPEEGRGTLCVSSQVGCTLTCTFCHTGTQRLVRNLTPEEIVGQVMVARDRLGDFIGMTRAQGPGLPTEGERCVSNIVMMGMGEPLYNFEAVRDALGVVQDGDGLAISRRRITLSTSGVVPMIERAGAEIGVMLAISLHAVRDDLRNELVPLNKKYDIETLMDACVRYALRKKGTSVTFEYTLMQGVNDRPEHARALAAQGSSLDAIPPAVLDRFLREAKLHRLEENLVAASVELAEDDLARIEGALAAVQVQGDRYPASHQGLINR